MLDHRHRVLLIIGHVRGAGARIHNECRRVRADAHGGGDVCNPSITNTVLLYQSVT